MRDGGGKGETCFQEVAGGEAGLSEVRISARPRTELIAGPRWHPLNVPCSS